jgi:predicted RNase H-like HicB family nuclease
MLTFTISYTKISSGYMGQLIEWPEVISEGETLELCRQSVQDVIQEMIAAYRQQNKVIP